MEDPAEGAGIEGSLAEIRGRGFLARLPGDLADQIIGSATLVHHPSGSTAFPGSAGVRPAVVVTGLLRYYLSGADGRQITIRYLGVGDLVGTLTGNGSGLSTGFQAIEPSLLLHLDPARLRAHISQQPEIALAVVDELTGRLRHAYRALASGTFATVRSRVARDLLGRATASGELRAGVQLRLTQQALADATGSVREVVARALRELRREGVVATNHSSVTILDVNALAREARVGDA